MPFLLRLKENYGIIKNSAIKIIVIHTVNEAIKLDCAIRQ